MGGHMPYQLEKGPYFSVSEALLDDIDLRIEALLEKRATNADPDTMKTLNSQSLDTPVGPIQTEDQRKDHMNRHWYGKTYLGPGLWGPQQQFNAVTNPRTGFWHNWYGDAEGIVRKTYIRAIEVSLGIPHEPTPKPGVQPQVPPQTADWILANMTRAWPIEIFTRCPAPWFEGWVTWRDYPPPTVTRTPGDTVPPDTSGQVTIHLHTPSHDDSDLLTSPVRHAGYNTPEYRDEINKPPLPSGGMRGMWVISHLHNDLVPVQSPPNGPVVAVPSQVDPNHPLRKVPWLVPGFGAVYHSQGEIVVVQPSEPNGGVLANGRPYTP